MTLWEFNSAVWKDRKLTGLIRSEGQGNDIVAVVDEDSSAYHGLVGYIRNRHKSHVILEIPITENRSIKIVVAEEEIKEDGKDGREQTGGNIEQRIDSKWCPSRACGAKLHKSVYTQLMLLFRRGRL